MTSLHLNWGSLDSLKFWARMWWHGEADPRHLATSFLVLAMAPAFTTKSLVFHVDTLVSCKHHPYPCKQLPPDHPSHMRDARWPQGAPSGKGTRKKLCCPGDGNSRPWVLECVPEGGGLGLWAGSSLWPCRAPWRGTGWRRARGRRSKLWGSGEDSDPKKLRKKN